MKLATGAEMRELDRKAMEERGIPSIDLMEQAAEGVAEAALSLLDGRLSRNRAAVFCGVGNNGGDGIAAGRMMARAGVQTRVFLVGDPDRRTPDSLEESRRLSESGIALELFSPDNQEQRGWVLGAQVIVDAVFGVGLSREIDPDSRYGAAISLMNESEASVVAVDIASGVAADSGKRLGCAVKAKKTVTFTAPKIGQFVGQGAMDTGELILRDIGIPQELAEQGISGAVSTVEWEFASAALPRRKQDGHKGDFGKVLIVGGAVGYTGAPYLCASAAVHSGCGLVSLGVPESIWAVEAGKCVSAMPFPLAEEKGRLCEAALEEILTRLESCDVLALGPGLGRSEGISQLVSALLARTEKPVVLDADGINALEGHIDVLEARRGRVTILTPHDGEFARIGGDLSGGDRLGAARDFAQRYGCTLVLKGYRTITATPAGTALVNTTGNSGLAKGGSGDVLTGLIASFLAQGTTAVQAAALGVWVHGRSADLAAERLTPWSMTPEDVIWDLPLVFETL